ncbi:MAG: lipopolysaccharide biosynthesis protein [Bacteroidales bacterium]|nr:lipopolysaccharide biosynthesis protein [Bacteroidales bacterium]
MLFRDTFTKNLLTLVSGTSIAQLLPILIAPVLTRIYTPDDFGLLALFMSIATILGTVANLRYELAILLPKEDTKAINVLALGVSISLALSILSLLIIILFQSFILQLLEEPRLRGWIYLVPLVVLLIGMYNTLNYYSTRIKKYKDIALSKIFKSVTMVAVQLGLGLVKYGFGGLIIGYAASHLFGNMQLLKNVLREKNLIREITKTEMKQQAIRYKRFPQYTFPASLANQLANELANIFISIIYSVTTLGFYSLAIRMLAVPSSFVGTSIGQLYMQEATEEKHRTGAAVETFKSTLRKLVLMGLPFFLLIFIFAEDVFAFVFSEEWRIAGTYARYLIPLLFVRFVVSPVSINLSIFEKQPLSLILQSGLLFITLVIFGCGYWLKLEFKLLLLILVVSLCFYYLFFLLILFKTAKGNIYHAKK